MLKIVDKKAFLQDIKKDVISAFMTSFADSRDLLSVYDDSLLTMEIMEFWLSHFSLIQSGDSFYILLKERERLRMYLYKELCEKVLNKLVDNGVLLMMWDNKKRRVFWKKKEMVKNTQIV
jgi:hypothetical protein